jgi:predicted  nucleic acid-binding Zn-ribbon protein
MDVLDDFNKYNKLCEIYTSRINRSEDKNIVSAMNAIEDLNKKVNNLNNLNIGDIDKKVEQCSKKNTDDLNNKIEQLSKKLESVTSNREELSKKLEMTKKENKDILDSISQQLSNLNDQSKDYNSYKKITNERIEKLVKLFLLNKN